MTRFTLRLGIICGAFALAACALAACGETAVETSRAALMVACATEAEIPSGAWVCSESRTLSCDELATTTLYVPTGDALACEDQAIELSDNGPLVPGVHVVTVRSDNGAVCSSALTVIDETPPVLESHTIHLWSPNHKFHSINVNDCVTAHDDCDGELDGEILWVSSDEPVDDNGDGNTDPDIMAGDDCGHVSLRAERQGTQDGRVYTIGVRVTDEHGNHADAQCQVLVDHDQSGGPSVDSGEAYRLLFDGENGTPECPHHEDT